MFSASARLYDKIYAFKDYAAESARVANLAGERRTLLDVACGTGAHLEHLAGRFHVQGLELEPGLLEVAREKLPDVIFHLADMRDFRLADRFEVVTCLFSSIGYMIDPEDFRRAIGTMAAHLAPGGLLVLEPWFSADSFRPGHLHALLVDEPELKVARMSLARVEGRLSRFDFHYLVGTPEGVRHEVEPHTLALYTEAEYREALEAAGLLEVSFQPEGLCGRGLWTGRKGDAPGRPEVT
ncbi:MAG: class I SAM-dependent methyltransferase [Candidatus Eremiobacterota bacterium]